MQTVTLVKVRITLICWDDLAIAKVPAYSWRHIRYTSRCNILQFQDINFIYLDTLYDQIVYFKYVLISVLIKIDIKMLRHNILDLHLFYLTFILVSVHLQVSWSPKIRFYLCYINHKNPINQKNSNRKCSYRVQHRLWYFWLVSERC